LPALIKVHVFVSYIVEKTSDLKYGSAEGG